MIQVSKSGKQASGHQGLGQLGNEWGVTAKGLGSFTGGDENVPK